MIVRGVEWRGETSEIEIRNFKSAFRYRPVNLLEIPFENQEFKNDGGALKVLQFSIESIELLTE